MNVTEELNLNGLKILIVDDLPDNRVLLSRYLTMSGGTYEIAANGKEAIEQTHKNKFDAVLMDLQMPIMDGELAMKTLKAEGYQTPIVAITAHAMKGERERCLEVGFDGYISKPVQRLTVVKIIVDLVKKS